MRKRKKALSKQLFFILCIISCLSLYGGYQYMTILQLQHDLVKIGSMKYIDYNVSETEEGIEYRVTPLLDVDKKVSFCDTQIAVFQSFEEAEFPSSSNKSPKIPHKIHQICDSESVLDIFVEPMQSFVANNPTWEYWFWTYDSGRKLLEDRYSYLLDVYDSFDEMPVKKSDLLRIAILHSFGGVYADLDVRNVRSLDKATLKYACIIPAEPFEHSSVLYVKNVVLSSALLLCKPEHPFFTQLLLNLQFARSNTGPVDTAGPIYITNIYMLYNNLTESLLNKTKTDNSSNSPYFYKGTMPEDDDNAVYVPNSQYFMDNVDPNVVLNGYFGLCGYPTDGTYYKFPQKGYLQERGCNEYECRRAIRKSMRFTFTVHHWYHMWTKPEEYIQSLKKVHINRIFRNYNYY